MFPMLCYIIPVSGGSPPGIWGGGNVPMPTPPIQMPPGGGGGGSPPGIWGPTDPRPGWGLPGNPGGGVGQPPGIWGPTDPRPGWGLPGQPPGIWGGGGSGAPMPTPPIVIDDPVPPELPDMPEDVPVGAMLIVVSTPDGPKWAYIPPGPGYNPPPGGNVPQPVGGEQSGQQQSAPQQSGQQSGGRDPLAPRRR